MAAEWASETAPEGDYLVQADRYCHGSIYRACARLVHNVASNRAVLMLLLLLKVLSVRAFASIGRLQSANGTDRLVPLC